MINVNIFNDSGMKMLPRKSIVEYVTRTLVNEKVRKANINIVYVDSDGIMEINKQFLKHNYITDVISFNLEDNEILLGEIYICADRALSQAEDYGVSLKREIERLAVHGSLHLVGYDDSTAEEKEIMTKLENSYLN